MAIKPNKKQVLAKKLASKRNSLREERTAVRSLRGEIAVLEDEKQHLTGELDRLAGLLKSAQEDFAAQGKDLGQARRARKAAQTRVFQRILCGRCGYHFRPKSSQDHTCRRCRAKRERGARA